MTPDVIGRPWTEAELLLTSAHCCYQTEITRPTRDFFKTDVTCLYVVRLREQPDGTLFLTLVAKQKNMVEEVF